MKIFLLSMCTVLCLAMSACGKSEAAKNVEVLINEIGTVSDNSGNSIENARKQYDLLTVEEKESVSNYQVLQEAEDDFGELTLAAVREKIAGIGEVTFEKKTYILEARAAYDKLAPEYRNRVENYRILTDAEAELLILEKLEAVKITNYASIATYKVDPFEETVETWYGDPDASATLFILFYLTGYNSGQMDVEKLHMLDEHIGVCEEENRVDIYAPYGETEIMGIQYWPGRGKAQIGTVVTDLTIDEYLQILVDGKVIDRHREIPFRNITGMMNLMESLA